MDEYTFLVVAKLKADQRKLAREQREPLVAAAPQPSRNETLAPGHVRGRRMLFSKLEWREQS